MEDEQQIIERNLKEGSPTELEIDEEMELDEGSAGEEEEEEEVGDPGSSPSPEEHVALGHGSSEQAGTSGSSFSFSQEDGSAIRHKHSHMSGKPLSLRRGPGRPRKDRPCTRSSKKSIGLKLKRWKSNVYVQPMTKSPPFLADGGSASTNPVLDDVEPSPESPSPVRSADDTPATSTPCVDPDTGQSECTSVAVTSKTEKTIASEEPPYFQEQWPGKVCALCNLGERSQLGQGDLMRFSCPEGFTPHKSSDRSDAVEMMSPLSETYTGDTVDRESIGSGGDKSPRGSGAVSGVTCRRQKVMAKSRSSSQGSSAEQLDELSVVGHPDEPESAALFESSGHFYVHQSCALWSSGVTRTEDLVMENVGPAVLEASKRRCSYCSHFGATITCIVNSCARMLHFPCAAASGAFQDCKTVTMVCNQHLDQVPLLLSGDVTCMCCFALGDVSNLMMCTNCGHHYHGSCVGLALFPGVRAGWQCPDCRVCQVCRQPEEDSKVMLCEKCDKAYHPQCLRPIVTTIPKIGWKCKCCRVCSDCGSRTPGAGLSSRWHAHYTVCDSCYQQRNKGFCCPVCGRAYRAAAQREMVQCTCCRKFVHGTCDVDADLATYNRKKESNPDYVYMCLSCKQRTQSGREMLPRRKDSTEDGGLDSSLTGSQESLYAAEDSSMELEYSSSDKYSDDGSLRAVGLGKGKPFCASKIAKKKLGFGNISGRPKGIGNGGTGVGKVIGGYQKRQRVTDFGRKRAPKAKMRGIFGVPGLGLQRPQADSSFNKSEEEPGVENRLVLCSAKDKFVLTQDICVMCGAIGIDQEGCLIACAQCGQCYHPYCVNVKVTKVILQKGWRCLDCTVCEGCGQRNDEGRLILCDDCDISFHIYCMDPPLDYVPHGNWKCKWCAMCVSCGSNDPGFNCMWQKSFTECGPCASHTTCPSCLEPYNEGDLIIQCVQCERWLHCLCDQIRTEAEAERCAEDGYNCVLCRPRDVPPPHLLPPPPPPKPPTPTKSPETPKLSSQAQFYMDGVCLSEMGLHQIKSLTLEQQQQSRKKRITKKIPTKADKEAGILATIESVVAGGSLDSSLEHDPISKLELDEAKEDAKLEPVEVYKEGMVVPPREDGRPPEPPEGFTIHTTESGVMVLRRKRQRNLQKLGIGGFNVRLRNARNKDKDEEGGGEVAPGAVTPTSSGPTNPGNVEGGSAAEDKPRRKAQRRRLKNRLMECYPLYLQEAFFGRDLLDTTKEKDIRSSSDSDEECTSGAQVSEDKIIQLSQDELKVMEEVKAKQEKDDEKKCEESESGSVSLKSPGKEEDEGSDTEGLKDILPGDLLDTDIVNTIMNGDDDITKNEDNLDDIGDAAVADDSVNDSLSMPDGSADVSGTSHKDELGDILSPNFNLESMVSQTGLPNMDSKDVEEIFKGVLTDESQESQESVFPLAAVGTATSTPVHTSVPHNAGMVSPSGTVAHPALQSGVARPQVSGPLPPVGQPNLSPVSFPPPSPYHSEYSNSPFSEPPSPWLSQADVEGIADGGSASTPTSVNRQTTLKMEADEALGNSATISSVLYANVNHPEWKSEFPAWGDRHKQILKKWRALPSDRKAPFLQQARENRAALRMKKTQQIPKDITKPSIGSVSPQSTPSTSGITGVIGGASQLTKKAAGGGETGGSVVTSIALAQQKSGAGDGGGSLSPSSNVVEVCGGPRQSTQAQTQQRQQQQQQQQQQITSSSVSSNGLIQLHSSSNTTPNLSASSPVNSQPLQHQIQHQQSPHSHQTTPPPPSPVYQSVSSHVIQQISNQQVQPTTSHIIPYQYTVHHQVQQQYHSAKPVPIQHTGLSPVNTAVSPPRPLSAGRAIPSPNVVVGGREVIASNTGNILSTIGGDGSTGQHLTLPPNSLNQHHLLIAASGRSAGASNLVPPVQSQSQPPSQPTPPPQQPPPPPQPTPPQPLPPQQSPPPPQPVLPPPPPVLPPPPSPPQPPPLPPPLPLQLPPPPPSSLLNSGTVNPVTDQQIRVLTPSEIMRTLPSLGQETYDLPSAAPTDQEKIIQQQKTCREAEQERQWKQLQALRQQQAQQQQQNIHDQRTQAMVRVHRQMSADGVSFSPDQAVSSLTTQLQVSTTQDPNTMAPLSSPSPGSRTQFPSPQVKVSRVLAPHSPGSTAAYPHTNLPPPPLPPPLPTVRQDMLQPTRPPALNLPRGAPTAVVRMPEPFSVSRLPFSTGSQPQSPFSPQSPHEQFPQSPVSSVAPTTPQSAAPLADPFQRSPSETPSDPYTQPPHTPRPEFITNGHQSQRSPVYVSTPCPTSDPYVQSPATPRPQFTSAATRPSPQVVYTPARLQHPQQDPYTSQPPTPRPAQIDPFVQQITTARPQDPYVNQPHAPRPQPVDPYVQQPATPRPRTEGEIFGQQQPQQGPEVNRQLRDLLQRQKLEQDQVVQSQPRLWSPQGVQESGIHQQTSPVQQTSVHFEAPGAAPIVQQQQQQQAPTSPHPVTATNADTTFRQPLPPALVRPRLPSQGSVVIRGPVGVRHPLQGLDPRLQGVDPRMRMLIQQQRGAVANVQAYPAHIVHRLAGPRNPLDPYDHLVQQRQQLGFPQDGAVAQGVLTPNATVLATQHLVRPPSVEGGHANPLGVQMRLTRVTPQPGHPLDHTAAQRAAMSQTPAGPGQIPAVQQHVDSPAAVTAVAASAPDTQEIPESVTAELEKLEQEGGAMVEVEGVGAILAELGDDKELLEMGNDFNILEYADPELDSVTGGEKTNILDENLDLEEEDNSKEEHKGVKKEVPDKDSNNSENRPEKPAESVNVGSISSAAAVVKDDTSNSTSAPPTAVETDPAVSTSPVAMQPATTPQPALQPQPQDIHQHQVQPPQQIQQPQPQPLQQAPVSPMTQQPSVCRPVVAGRMVSPDGGVAVSFQSTFPPAVSSPSVVSAGVAPLQCLPPGHLQVQQQRVQMRMVPAGIREGPARVVSVVPGSPVIQHSGVGVRMGLAPPPPPPPYPGPPPPYPGPCQQMPPSGLRGIGVGLPLGPPRPPPITMMPQMVATVPGGMMHPPGGGMGPVPGPPHLQRRPLLLQEQPLLLEDLLEQEKREQEKQQQHQPLLSQQPQPPPDSASSPLLSDVDFERLRADVLGTTTPTAGSPGLGSPPQGIPAQGLLPSPNLVPVVASNLRQSYPPRPAAQPQTKLIEWQPTPSPALDTKLGPGGIVFRQQPAPGVQGEAAADRVPLFNAPHLPAPPLPPENITTEQDRQTQIHYEQWLNHQNQIVTSQLKYYETEVNKLRKMRKSLNSKQRQLRKSGNELAEVDALELQRISREQGVLQKHLDASRKQSRQHGMLIQEYRNKQQQKQRQQQGPGSVGPPNLLIGPPSLSSNAPQQQSVVIHSPLGPPSSSPIHHPSTPQSPMMSPSPSPMMQQHSSPLHSPGPLLSHSPGPGSVTSVLQHSPGNTGPGSNSGMSPHSMQPSPRMGTPHSQSEECPFSPGTPQELLRSLPSPQQVCPPPTGRLTSPQGHVAPRMTSPQQRVAVSTPQVMGRLVTSPVSYTGSQQQFSGGEQVRIHNIVPRFVRSPLGAVSEPVLQRPRGLPVQGPGPAGTNNVMYCQPSSTPNMRAGIVYSSSVSPSPLGSPQPIISTAVSQQQFQQTASQPTSACGQMAVRQIQQSPQDHDLNLLLAQRQQLQLVQQRQMQQRQQMMQQQQQLVQRGQQQQQQQTQPPSSPLTPRSPMIGQNQPPSSPMLHQQNTVAPPTSPMPPRSPMVQSLNQSQTPNSPMPPQSPMLQQMIPTQPPSSPMPPCSPVIQQQYQQQISQNQPPSSPILRSPMVQNHAHSVGSPMQMRHPSSAGSVSNSPGLPDRPQSVENPPTPRTPHTPHTPYTPQNNQQGGESSQDNDSVGGGGGGGGGGNPNNPANPLPLPAMFGRFGYFKLGLRGGSPMWSMGSGYGKGGRRNDSRSNDDKKGSASGSRQEKDVGESTSGSKVEGQVESKLTRQSGTSGRETRGGVITPTKNVAVVSTVASLVCVDYNDFDDENSHTPPLTPPLPQDDRHITSGSLPVDGKAENIPAVTERISEQDVASTEKLQELPSGKPSNQDGTEREASNNAKELIEEKCGEEIEVAIMSQEDILGSDTVVSSDLPVESLGVEETDCGNVVVFEHLSESDLAQVSSSIDTDIIEECIVTSSDIVMDISVVDALESCEKLTSCMQKDDDEVLHLVEEENKIETGDVDDGLGGIELAEGGDDIPNMDMDVMHILDTGVRGVLDRDPVLDMPEGCREIHSMNERLRIGIVRSLGPLQQEKIVAMTDTPESPDQEEMNVDPSPEPYLPTPDTIKDDEDDMMPMMHDDTDIMELDETSGTEIENDSNEIEATEMNATGSAEVAASGGTASVDSAGDGAGGGTPRTHSVASEEAGKRDHPFGMPLASQLPPSSVHQANIGVPGSTRTIVTYPTFPTLAVPAASYARGEHLINEEQTNTSATTLAAASTVITSAITRQITSVVPSVVTVPCTVQFSFDSESVKASLFSAAKEKSQESPHISTTINLTSPSMSSAVVTEGTEITVSSKTELMTSECSTTVAHIPHSIIGVSPTFSIIKSSSPRRVSVLQGSSGSSTVPVCIIRPQSGGNANVNSTTVSIISSAVASNVTSSQLPSAAVANLVADAVNAARLPYPPASVGQHLPFSRTGLAPLMTVSPAGISVIANASSMSREGESLVPPPRMSIAAVTSSLSISPHVPVTVETDSSSIPAVETDRSSVEHQTNAILNSSPANIQARVGRKIVDIKTVSQGSDPQKEETDTSKLSQVTRPSTLETTTQNLVNELPLQSLGTEISPVQVIQKPVVKVDDDDDDEILMKTVQLIFQESRPSVLATADRASSFPPQSAAAALQEETVATVAGSSEWQRDTLVDEIASSSETRKCIAVLNSSVTDKECKKDLTITEKLLRRYSLSSSSTVSAEPDQSERTKLVYDSSDRSSEIPTQTNATDTKGLLCTSQIQRSLQLPIQAVESAIPSHTQAVTDIVDAPVTSIFSQAAVCTTNVQTTLCGQAGAATVQPCGQSMLQSRLTTGAHQMAGRVMATPVPSPSVVMTSRLPSAIMSTGQAAASAVKQYVAYTQQQASSQTSPVITGVSKSSAVMRSLSPQLLTPSVTRLLTQSSTNVLVPSLPTEQSVQSSVLPSRVLELQSSEIIQQTQASMPIVAVQHAASSGGSIRTASGDVRMQEPVEAALLSGRMGGDAQIPVCSESVAVSGECVVDSSKCAAVGYPYASSAPPRIQASSSVYTKVMQPQRRMSTGEMKPEEPARSCQFEQVAVVKTETLGSCLLKETQVPTTGFNVQQQRQDSAVVAAISKPIATSSTVVSRTPGTAVTPKTEAQNLASSCKFSSTTQPPTLPLLHRMEESQNVLLKQLLQNTGCAQQTSMPSHHQGLPVVPSLEAQLARPVPPTPSSLLPSLLTNDSPLSQPPKNPQTSRPTQLTTNEAPFISRPSPPVPTSPSTPLVCQQQQTQYIERRPGPPSRTPSREDVLSPPTPTTPRLSTSGADSSHHTPSPLTSPPVMIKKETAPPQQSPVHPVPSGDVKKEFVSDDSAVPLASEKKEFPGKTEQPSRDEISDLGIETASEKTTQDQAALDIKKIKRRLYQQKRRQSQGKEPAGGGGTPKKQRVRKGSKVDEDYDTYIENLMTQLRQLPPMSVLEPTLSRNYAVCSIFGSGDLTKIGTSRDYSTRQGDLKGTFGGAHLAHVSDHYNTQPFGDLPPLPPQPAVSTQRGFYDQEFAALKLENDDDKKQDIQAVMNRDHDNDTPDTVISSSSPECVIPEFPIRFPGLKLIEEEDSEKEEDTRWLKRASPIVPIISPIPIRPRPGMQIVKEMTEVDKENVGVSRDLIQLKTRFGVSPPAPLRDAGNVTVTLTLTSAAAEDILGVLRNLANILSIPAPSGYQIVERTSTPPSQKLGLYRTKGKDGKEGAPIDIQSILNGAAKFCRHCDVVILSNLIRKKVSELPFLAKDDLVENGDDLYFCSSTCYMQFALMHRSPSISEDKAAAIVDHLCQTTQSTGQKKVHPPESAEKTKKDDSIKEKKEEDEKMDVEQQQDKIKVEENVAEKDEPAEMQVKEVDCVVVKTELPVTKPEPEPTPAAAVTTPQSTTPPRVTSSEKKSRRHTGDDMVYHCPPPAKVWKGLKYKYWSPGALQPAVKYKRPTDKEITEMLFRMGITMTPAKIPDDTRKCMFCHQIGDGVADGPARLLNFDVDKWVHLNCALWSDDVYETVNGALMNLENSLQQSLVLNCVVCHRTGATIRCFKLRCSNVYHLGCAVKDGCVFFKNKSTYCTAHIPKNEKDNELTTLSVFRRVYVNRDENRQVATVMHQDHNNLLRVGSLIFLSVGQLLPHQLQAFHTPNYIYPIGFKIVRFYWSMRVPNKRCRYVCSIHDVAGRPEFRVLVQEPCQDDLELRDTTPRAVWARILEPLATLRKEMGGVQVFPRFVSGEDLFGLTEPAVVRVLESLPGVETLTDYRFKYGRNPLLELPLAVNPTGCARTEPKLRNQFLWKRPHTQRTGSSSRPIFVPTATAAGEAACPYSKQFVHSKSSQYKKMKQEWRNNVYLARSKIQGLGLYAARDLERHTMVIEYIGEVIRTELSELREKLYEARNRGIYMFRLDEDRVVDATLSGGLARYINHSCNPNCVAEIVEVERDLRIIIFAKRRISRGEELAYDYKFDIEDDQHKIPCNCGAPNCRKWMN